MLTSCSMCLQVDGVFIWNDASWDVQAVYPESTTSEGSYRDTYLVNLFNQHNARAIGGSAGSAVSSASVSDAASPVAAGPDATAAAADPSSASSSTSPPLMVCSAPTCID